MIEIILGIIGLIEAPIFFFLGTHYGKKHSKDVIIELKEQKEHNIKLSEKVDDLTNQNEDLSGKIGELESQNIDQKVHFLELFLSLVNQSGNSGLI